MDSENKAVPKTYARGVPNETTILGVWLSFYDFAKEKAQTALQTCTSGVMFFSV